MKSEREIKIALLVLLGLALLSSMTACRASYGYNPHRHKREIKRAMRHASWQYAQPRSEIMIPHSQSNFVFETGKK